MTHNPNEKSRGFTVVLLAVLLVIVVAVGFIVFNGHKKHHAELQSAMVDAHVNVEVKDYAIRLTSDATTDSAKEVDLYEDYTCHFCQDLAKATDADMLKAIEDGRLIVNIRSLNFLDRDQIGHSTMSGAAALAVAKTGDGKAYWNLRSEFLERASSKQLKWKAEDYAEAATIYDAPGDAVKSIKDSKILDEYKETSEANTEKLKEATGGKVSSPHVFADGKEISPVQDWMKTVLG